MQVIIDRLEGQMAVAELPNGTFVNIPLALLPGVREGDSVRLSVIRKRCRSAVSAEIQQLSHKLRQAKK